MQLPQVCEHPPTGRLTRCPLTVDAACVKLVVIATACSTCPAVMSRDRRCQRSAGMRSYVGSPGGSCMRLDTIDTRHCSHTRCCRCCCYRHYFVRIEAECGSVHTCLSVCPCKSRPLSDSNIWQDCCFCVREGYQLCLVSDSSAVLRTWVTRSAKSNSHHDGK